MRSMTTRLWRSLLLAGGLVLAMAIPVSAGQPVDPNTLTPPPPDFFNAVCVAQGHGITCSLAFGDPEVVNEPSGIMCGSVELRYSQSRSVVGKRYYSRDGLLLRRHFRETFSGDFTNPTNGRRLLWTGHDTILHDLASPGDVESGTWTVTGIPTRVTTLTGRTILVDAGQTTIDAATGDILSSRGPHHFDDYFARGDTHALDPLCAAIS